MRCRGPASGIFQPGVFSSADFGRYDDEQLYAMALYIYWLKPPANPNPANDQTRRGAKVFEREGCAVCDHAPRRKGTRRWHKNSASSEESVGIDTARGGAEVQCAYWLQARSHARRDTAKWQSNAMGDAGRLTGPNPGNAPLPKGLQLP